jgi:hypothetical protein
MKNAYLNSVFILRLYLLTIQKRKKNIVNKTKKKRKSLSKLNHNTYLLNFEDEDRTTNRD